MFKRIISAMLVGVVGLSTVVLAVNPEPKVIPAVKQWQGGEGYLAVKGVVFSVPANSPEEVNALTRILHNELVSQAKLNYEAEGNSSVHIHLDLNKDHEIPAEGYELVVDKGISIKASTAEGLYYGTRTLLQMLSQSHKLAKGTIIDEPTYQVRSVLLDTGRKFIPYEELKDWVIALSYFKMNEIHLHLNDNCFGLSNYGGFRVEMKTIPGLTSQDGYYTQKQIRELQDMARLRGVEIVPEIDSPGHSRSFTTVRPDLSHPKLGGNYLDINNEGTYKFMEKVLDEVVPLFDAKHFHIGTDEYRLGAIGDKAERDATGEKFRQYINHFNKYLSEKHGKTVRIWSGYEHMPGTTEPTTDVVIDMWETSDAVNKSKAGYKVINSSHFYTYIVPGAAYYGTNNVFLYDTWTPLMFSGKPEGMLEAGDENLLGGKLHIWNDKGTAGYTTNEIARISMPTVMVMAEKTWGTKGSANFEAFSKRADVVLGGDDIFEMTPASRGGHSPENVMLGNVPGTKFLVRKALGDNDLVWQLDKKDQYFIANTSKKLNIANGATDLEYPWTAKFVITRNMDLRPRWDKRPGGHEILLASDLATMYLDYTQEVRNDKGEVTERKQGVGMIRANGAYFPSPEYHGGPDVIMFDYKVPVGKKVTLEFVGYQKRTELYADGKLVGTSNTQMVCPVEFLGDGKWRQGFNGILHDAKIYGSAPEQKVVWKWEPSMMSEEFKAIEIGDIIDLAGDYMLTFQYTKGACRLDIRKVAVYCDGKEIAVDEHVGITGGKSSDNTFKFTIDKFDAGKKYVVKAEIRSDGGTDSNGIVMLKKGRK
ncbi:MAG: family 20 glycosylhydrolase [Phycisphaerae bacterium]|nr:family 20 glycosylhydrolase [Phycisphaerae bacterium]